jgi:hypothetical protein
LIWRILRKMTRATGAPVSWRAAKVRRYSGQRPPANSAEVVAVVAFKSSPLASAVHGAIFGFFAGLAAAARIRFARWSKDGNVSGWVTM